MSVEVVVPAPSFEVTGARVARPVNVPTLELDLEVTESSALLVYCVALHVQVHLEPARRPHDDETRARLHDLFGPPERWSSTAGTVPWMAVDALVPSFTGRTTYALSIPFGFDHEVAATRYCGALREGVVPLDLHFNGMVYHRGPDGRLQMVLIPWSAVARFDLPWEVWRDAVRAHYPSGGWVALEADTIERLTAHRTAHGLQTHDQVVADLLDRA